MSSQPLFATTTSHRLNSATQGHTYKVHCSITSHVDEATHDTAYFRGALFGGPSPAGLTT